MNTVTHEPDGGLTIWTIADGRPGHWNQVRGLCEALSRRTSVRETVLKAPKRGTALRRWLFQSWPEVRDTPGPDLIVGAGHATHLPMLLARRLRGGKAIVLMKPSLPLKWFDLCFVPDMQSLPNRPNVVRTRGAINRVRRASAPEPDQGTFLIGGPSAHHGWDGPSVLRQIDRVCAATPTMHWELTTSRRTPPGFVTELRELGRSNVTVFDCSDTGPDWLPERLARSSQAWVTADSVSMIYECLTAGAAVGLLSVPLLRTHGKMARSLEGLLTSQSVTAFDDWQHRHALVPAPLEYNEADRCAELLLERIRVARAA